MLTVLRGPNSVNIIIISSIIIIKRIKEMITAITQGI